MPKRTIYVVCSGEYSDYRVHAAFIDKATAEAASKLEHDYQGYYVEERILYDTVPKVITVWQRTAGLGKDGRWGKFGYDDEAKAHKGPEFDPPWTWFPVDGVEFSERRRAVAQIAPYPNGLGWSLTVAGPTKESVDKLFSEKKARMLVDFETLGDPLPH